MTGKPMTMQTWRGAGNVVELHEGRSCNCVSNGRHLLITNDEDAEQTRVFAVFFAPRPNATRGGMTKVGVLRDEYSATVEGHPSRFVRTSFGYEANPAYFEWASRADTWARAIGGSL